MRTYNLFRREGENHLVCAVPEDCAIPGFIDGPAWEFDTKLTGATPTPTGFDPRAAADGARFHGFYLFQRFIGPRERAADRAG